MGPYEEVSAMSTQANETTVRNWVGAGCNNGDLSMVDTHYAPGYVGHGPGPAVVGAEAFKQFVMMWRTGFPDFHMTIEDLIAAGDQVAWRVTITGTQHGSFLGVPPTSRSIRTTCIVITRFDAGKWAEDYIEVDLLTLLQQLGAIPAPAAAAA
jgi:predicted ester cyclase